MRMLVKAAAASLGLGAAVFIALSSNAADEADIVAKGHDILEFNCARCHAIGMEDTSHHEEAPPFRVVVTRYPPEDLAEALAEGIISGHPDMPEFVFEPPEIEAILAYLNTLPRESPSQEN